MKRVNLYIIYFILFFYLTSSYLSSTHIHSDTLIKHSECKVSILIKNINSGDDTIIELLSLLLNYYYELIFTIEKFSLNSIDKGFNSQAPPL